MKKITMIAFVLLITAVQSFAQKEFKLAKTSGKLVIKNIANLTVEGYNGKEIIISTQDKNEATDPRAEGLSAFGNGGFDNTDIGLNVTQKDQIVEVFPVNSANSLKVLVKLPEGVAISIKTSGSSYLGDGVITLNNVKSEIDVSTQYDNVKMKNVTGPASVKTLHGNIEGFMLPAFKGPVSLISVYGFVDVSVPENIKADLSINTQFETFYAAKDLKIKLTETKQQPNSNAPDAVVKTVEGKNMSVITVKGGDTIILSPAKIKGTAKLGSLSNTTTTITSGDMVKLNDRTIFTNGSFNYTTTEPSFFSKTGTTVKGTLNGGGENILLKSTYGKIYLRK